MNSWTYSGETEIPAEVEDVNINERFGEETVYFEDGKLIVLEFFGDGWDIVEVNVGDTITWGPDEDEIAEYVADGYDEDEARDNAETIFKVVRK